MSNTKRLVAVMGSIVLGGGLAAPAAHASRRADPPPRRPAERVTGRWGGAVPCVPTAVDTTSNHLTCVGSTTWVGGLTGQTHYTFDGTVDLTTGAGQGTVDETFTGTDTAGRVGTLRFSETLISVATGLPSTGSVSIDARVVDGTGDFAGVRGGLAFRGIVNVMAGDLGTYAGQLTDPRR